MYKLKKIQIFFERRKDIPYDSIKSNSLENCEAAYRGA